jgi:hypothetical protein
MAADVRLVVVGRPGAVDKPFQELVEDMRSLAAALARGSRPTARA